MNSQPPPDLSIIVASTRSGSSLEDCLQSLILQSKAGNVEIIAAQAGPLKGLSVSNENVRCLSLPQRSTLPELWGAGLAVSRGKIIAITDSSCRFDERWISSILEAHGSPDLVIGGAVEVGECRKLVDWAAYFCEYGQFMRPLSGGVATELPGNNVTFKRSALSRGREFANGAFWKSYWCRRLQADGVQLILCPRIVAYYCKSFSFIPFLSRRFHHGRCFAGMRLAGGSILARLLYGVGSVFLPFLFLARTVRAVVPKRRHLKQFVLSFPIAVLAALSWSVGESFGYLFGSGKSCANIY